MKNLVSTSLSFIPRRPGRGFSLVEVMVALALFFMALFAILGLVSTLLNNARVFQTKKAPGVSMVHAYWTSVTNRVEEGLKSGEFSDLGDFNGLYRDYGWEVYAEPDLELTNGLWDVTYRVINHKTHKVELEVFTYYFDPNTKSKAIGGGLGR